MMEIIEVSPEYYQNVIPEPYIIYNSSDFNLLNSDKCEKIKFFLFKQGKYKLGICGGISNNCFSSPFSAPSGGFSFVNKSTNFEIIDDAIVCLENYLKKEGIVKINIILPPTNLSEDFISKQINTYFRKKYTIKYLDVNYYFDLKNFDNNYLTNIWHNARKNYRISLVSGFDFIQCNSKELITKVYEIIRENRKIRGFPLRMSLERVFNTTKIIDADFFLLGFQKKYIASAIVFHIAENIVQIVYWGDIPDYSEYKPMNFLSYKIFEFYKEKGIKSIDIGISTVNSIPNFGLCNFKESIGCNISIKYTIEKNI